MSDIRLTWGEADYSADFTIDANDLETDDGLETAVLLSLFLDRRAEDSDTLPEGQTDRRGWWGDALSEIDGDKIGSRLWLLDRAKQLPETLDRAEEYVREALAWLIEDRVADRIDVAVSFPAMGILAITLSIFRPTNEVARYRWNYNWQAQEARIS